MTTAEDREALARAHAYYCTHAPVRETDRLIARYLMEHPAADAIARRRAAEELRVSFRWAADAYYHRPRADVHDWLWELGDTRADALEAE